MTTKTLLILAIDTSCDDTSAAVTQGATVLSNVIASQTNLHKEYGGVFPTVAKKAHREKIEPTVGIALKRAGVKIGELDAVAVTQGPGLAPALEVGIEFAQNFAQENNLPLIAVNHIEAHALSSLAEPNKRNQPSSSWTQKIKELKFPALAIVVSGGHTEFVKVSQIGEYERLGWTLDDSAGEALDKVGRMLGLGYPAAPIIEEFAQKGDAQKYTLPLPMTDREDFNMSFSGLKTWARNKIEEIGGVEAMSKQDIYDFSASFQRGVYQHICYKLNKLLLVHYFKDVWLGGGVAINLEIRRMLRETLKSYNLKLKTPNSARLCMDNAAMIGLVAGHKFLQKELVSDAQKLDRIPRWKIA